MERNFFSLSSKDHPVGVKEELDTEGFKDIGLSKGPEKQWTSSNSVASRLNPTSNAEFQNMKPQLLRGASANAPRSTLPAGVNESSVMAPPQLTIFYGGRVNVYTGISPQKVQAIMVLAENGSSKVKVQEVGDGDGTRSSTPGSTLSSPKSASSHTGDAKSGSGSNSSDEQTIAKTTEIQNSIAEPPKLPNVVATCAPPAMIPSVPQARKASLARFFEKRKERVMNAAPYNLCKKSVEEKIGETNSMDGSRAYAAVRTGSVPTA